MSIANWCVLAASVLPVLTVGLAKGKAGMKSPRKGGYDNHNPRQWEAQLSGWQQRAVAAQANGFEALPLFIAVVLMAQQAHADQARIDQLALAFVGIRLVYTAMYLLDKALLRSLVWTAGLGVCIAILAMAG
ncbi:MAG TPA: MAPEG family protein [Aquabacterium sp.]|nr:MAPEG family protein [Aquabacterium sp.]